MRCYSSRYKPMELVSLDLESDRPRFIEDPTFNVIPNIEDFIDAVFDFLGEDILQELIKNSNILLL